MDFKSFFKKREIAIRENRKLAGRRVFVDKNHKINNKAISGFMWMFSGTGIKGILQFIVLIVLARLILPEEFGLVSVALLIISFTEILSMLGIGPAIIQRSDLTKEHVYTGFTSVLLLNLFLAISIFTLSPLFSAFFKMPELEIVLRFLCLVFLIKAFGVVAEFITQRNLRFRLYSMIQVISYLMYCLIGITLALLGFGVWALVIAHITQSLTSTILFLYYQPHYKKLSIHKESLKELLYFGSGYSVARLANQLALQGDNLIIGKFMGATSVGLYGRAYQLMAVPAVLFGEVMDKVLFPIMSNIQNDREKLEETYLTGISLTAVIILPISAVIIVLAEDIILLLFGSNWVSIVDPVKILSIGMLFRTSYKISDSLVRAKGAVYRRALRQSIYAISVVIGTFIGHYWGLIGVSIGVLFSVTINFIMMSGLSLTLLESRWTKFIKFHVRPLLFSIVIYIISNSAYIMLKDFNYNPLINIILTLVILVILVFLLLLFLPKVFIGEKGIKLIKNLKKHYIN